MSSEQALHLNNAGRAVAQFPQLSAAIQERFLDSCANDSLNLPQQYYSTFCHHCRVPFIPGFTLHVFLTRDNIFRTKGGLNSRARRRALKNKANRSRPLQLVYKCTNCGVPSWTKVDIPKPQPNVPASKTTTDVVAPTGSSSGESAKSRAKNRKKKSSLQQLVKQQKQANTSGPARLDLSDFLKPS